MSFSDNLRALRKERSLSQEALAELLNVSRQAVSKWEQGAGYPEMEKMLLLSRELNVSLDDLISGAGVDEGEAPPAPQDSSSSPAGKIRIKSQDGKAIATCCKVLSSPRFRTKADEPKYALFGVDGAALWGENTTHLGWYADEESLKLEMGAILEAMDHGEPSYELQYAAKVKRSFLSVKLDEEAVEPPDRLQ